jgi:exodeoxyribonuclease V gamma subunit
VLLDETELFSLDKLQQWKLKNRLLTETDIDAFQKKLVKTGELPLKNMASVAVLEMEETVLPVRNLFNHYTQQATAEPVTFSITAGSHVLSGTIHNVYNKMLVQVSWSKQETKQLIETYIRYLAGVAAGKLSGAYFISGANKEAAFKAVTLTPETAIKRLTTLLDLYREGFSHITPFYPEFDIKPKDVLELDDSKFKKKVDQALESADDLYIVPEYKKGFFDAPEVLDKYKTIAVQVLVPLAEIFPGYYD